MDGLAPLLPLLELARAPPDGRLLDLAALVVARDQLRRRRVSELPTLRLDADGRDVLGELADHRAAVDPLAPAIRSELGRLSSKVRLPLELKYMRGQTNREIAESLGISISNVKVQLARGKDLLASRLEAIGVAWGKASGVGSHEEEGEA